MLTRGNLLQSRGLALANRVAEISPTHAFEFISATFSDRIPVAQTNNPWYIAKLTAKKTAPDIEDGANVLFADKELPLQGRECSLFRIDQICPEGCSSRTNSAADTWDCIPEKSLDDLEDLLIRGKALEMLQK